MDFARLLFPERFEELCKLIVKYEVPDAIPVDGRGGDEGTDTFVGSINNQIIIFQFKFFPGKLDSSDRSKIKKSLKKSLDKKPKKWVLLVPGNLTQYDLKWWEKLEKDNSDTELAIWDFVELERLALKYQSQVAVEFPELFPQTQLAREMAREIIHGLQDFISQANIAASNFEVLTPIHEFNSGSSECWKRAFFTLDDIHDNYDTRNPITDEIISSIESNKGTLIFGKPYHGKSTILKRIMVEELKRGYIILSTSILNANSNQLIHLISALDGKYYRILVVVDDIHNNTLNKEIFKCYNRIGSDKIKFLLLSRKDEFDLLKKSLLRDDVSEVEIAISSMNIIDLRFDETLAQLYLEKAFEIYGLKHPDLRRFIHDLFTRSRGDPLMFSYAIIDIITSRDFGRPSETSINYLQKNFNEILNTISGDPTLLQTTVYCLFLGTFGFKISLDLLANCNIHSDDLVKLRSLYILNKVADGYEIRHEEWAKEFLIYIISKDYDNHYDSFFIKNHLPQLLTILSEKLPVYDTIILFNRLAALTADTAFRDFSIFIVNNFPHNPSKTDIDKSKLLCYGYGDFCKKIDDVDQARRYYREAIALNPNFDAAFNNLGNILEDEDVDEAIKCYDKTISLNSTDPIAPYNKGRLLNKIKKYRDGIKFLKLSVKLDPFYEWSYLEIGNSLVGLDLLDEAISYFKKVIELNPLHVEPWISIGNILLQLENYTEANYYYEKAKKIDAKNQYVWYHHGLMFARIGQVSDALFNFRKSLELGIGDAVQLDLMYQYFLSHGDINSANTCLKRRWNLQ